MTKLKKLSKSIKDDVIYTVISMAVDTNLKKKKGRTVRRYKQHTDFTPVKQMLARQGSCTTTRAKNEKWFTALYELSVDQLVYFAVIAMP